MAAYAFSKERLRAQRVALDLSQAKLADLVEAHPVTVRQWEIGTRVPSVRYIGKLAAVLKCGPGDLFTAKAR